MEECKKETVLGILVVNTQGRRTRLPAWGSGAVIF